MQKAFAIWGNCLLWISVGNWPFQILEPSASVINCKRLFHDWDVNSCICAPHSWSFSWHPLYQRILWHGCIRLWKYKSSQDSFILTVLTAMWSETWPTGVYYLIRYYNWSLQIKSRAPSTVPLAQYPRIAMGVMTEINVPWSCSFLATGSWYRLVAFMTTRVSSPSARMWCVKRSRFSALCMTSMSDWTNSPIGRRIATVFPPWKHRYWLRSCSVPPGVEIHGDRFYLWPVQFPAVWHERTETVAQPA